MQKIEALFFVKDTSLEDFTAETMRIIGEQQEKGRQVSVDYKPVLNEQKQLMIHMAKIEAITCDNHLKTE